MFNRIKSFFVYEILCLCETQKNEIKKQKYIDKTAILPYTKSMENVKKYKIGQIEIKPNDRGSSHEPPFVNYTYEQTLFSIKSVYREVDVSLVFNYGNYREETEKGATAFFISAGYKLNLQKRLIYDRNDALTHFQGEDGKLVTLERFGNVFTFNDESQRILRRTEQIKKPVIGGDIEYGASTSYDHVIEYSDFCKKNTMSREE